ncbi:MAG: cyclic nucleotide-binding domain-containing protein [Bacteriovoracaceae bacterium]|nr:cyclic nucleotide-binding domain-containing protein [Bacteriovoracaceae bacterium]
MSENFQIFLKKDQILCREGDNETNLFIIKRGKLLVCLKKGTEVIPLAHLGAGEFVGELSFFDGEPRSANIIALEECELSKIPQAEITKKFPAWLILMAKQMTKKIRLYDEVVKGKGLKRKNVESVKPLTIQEQRHFFQILESK